MSKRHYAISVLIVVSGLTIADTNPPTIQKAQPDNRVTFTTVSGTIYSNCTIQRVEPDGISVIYQKGAAKILFTELPKSYQEKYGYDPNSERKFVRAVAEAKMMATVAESDKAHIEELSKNGFWLNAKVLQILTDGILVTSTMDSPDNGNPLSPNFKARYPIFSEGDTLFIKGAKADVDGAYWGGKVYDCGRYRYESVSGTRTIRKLAVSAETAYREK